MTSLLFLLRFIAPPFLPEPDGSPCVAMLVKFGADAFRHFKKDSNSPFCSATATTWEHSENPLNIVQLLSQRYSWLFLPSGCTICGCGEEELFD